MRSFRREQVATGADDDDTRASHIRHASARGLFARSGRARGDDVGFRFLARADSGAERPASLKGRFSPLGVAAPKVDERLPKCHFQDISAISRFRKSA